METYGKVLLIAMPVFLVFVLFEKWWGWKSGKDTVRDMDMISSLSSGATNVTKSVLGLGFTIISYGWLVNHVAVLHVKSNWLTYSIAFLALDLSGYWIHRIQHEYNFFWNNHIIHHSSEEFNLACALRQSISGFVNLFVIFLLPAALLGVPEKVIAIVAPLHLFAQFWYHTQHINKMGLLEKIIVTPSHHRVHHAINKEYLDKNYSQIFIWWDKWFGTYQEELKDIPPVYGITRPAQTWNPIKINFQHLWLLIKDAWRTESWKDKLRIWLMPTGWRPRDVEEKYPVYKIDDVYHFKKYNPALSKELMIWNWIQLVVLLVCISYLFANIAAIGIPGIFLYGLFVFLHVYAFTDLADRNVSAIISEAIKDAYGLALIFNQHDWFGAGKFVPYISPILTGYFIISFLITTWFAVKHRKEDSVVV